MKIGELSRFSGCSIQTIRYYERENLLPQPKRSEGNFRLYDQAILEQLMFIKRCRSLDMTLDEIRGLLAFKNDPNACCDTVNLIVDEHLGKVTARIRELQNLKSQLVDLQNTCSKKRKVEDCGILQQLSQATSI